MEEKANEKLVITVQEARKLLGLSRGLMYEAVRSGQIPMNPKGRVPRALPVGIYVSGRAPHLNTKSTA